MRAVVYARYSSSGQREVSISDQISAGIEYINGHGWNHVGSYADAAKSGRVVAGRTEFRRMLDDATKDAYDVVVVWNTDRINRNMINAFVTLSKLTDRKKDFRSVTQPELNENGPLRLILFALYSWKDELYSLDLGKNVLRGQRSNAEKCHPNGIRRFGYSIAGAYIDSDGRYHPGDRYEIEPNEAEAVVVACRLRAMHMSWDRISDVIYERGMRNRSGGRVSAGSIERAVRCEMIKGVYLWRDVRIDGGVPRIVSDELWERANSAKVSRAKPKSVGNGAVDVKSRGVRRIARYRRIEIGMRFGDLVVVSRLPNHKAHTMWLCECEACGGEKREWGQRLRLGLATDCGCRSTLERDRDDLGRFV